MVYGERCPPLTKRTSKLNSFYEVCSGRTTSYATALTTTRINERDSVTWPRKSTATFYSGSATNLRGL
jgi:hypothetical protein